MTSKPGGRPTVILADPIHAAGVERIGRVARVIEPEAFRNGPGATGPRTVLADATAVVVRTFRVTPDWLDGAPSLRAVVKHGAGVDNIDIPAATARGIVVCSTPGANSAAVAEGSVALMLGVQRRLREMDALVRENAYGQRWTIRLGDLYGRELGIVGFGRIGRIVAQICGRGFAMKVRAFDPFVSGEDMAAAGVVKADTLLDAMAADVVSVNAPLGAETRHLIGEAELAAMPPHGIIVNTARGGIIDETALARALHEGRIAGAGLDVFQVEPPPPDDPLFGCPNLILSPHVAGVTEESMRGTALLVADAIDAIVSGRRPPMTLNDPVPGTP